MYLSLLYSFYIRIQKEMNTKKQPSFLGSFSGPLKSNSLIQLSYVSSLRILSRNLFIWIIISAHCHIFLCSASLPPFKRWIEILEGKNGLPRCGDPSWVQNIRNLLLKAKALNVTKSNVSLIQWNIFSLRKSWNSDILLQHWVSIGWALKIC